MFVGCDFWRAHRDNTTRLPISGVRCTTRDAATSKGRGLVSWCAVVAVSIVVSGVYCRYHCRVCLMLDMQYASAFLDFTELKV